MRVLGVDPGTRFLGYGVLEVDGPSTKCLAWGTLEGGKKLEIHQRLFVLHQALREVVDRWDPDEMAIEEPFVAPARGAKSAVAVGQAQAVALLLAAACGMTVHRYGPSQVKAAVANYGAGSKVQVQRAVQLVLGLGTDPMGEDASDALAIGLCHIQHSRTANITGIPAGLHGGRSR
ncbi:MAG: crossover junction endodeoxyribonuclease RuvC [Chloroflexi bacterium]|nr:crossover junction endodeoxyribonuclease RuvC [Chloroflexota bacterium]MDA1172898.1 crossover junction endodeoxyribonuclease RuvC [Chloroflexota bacterium]